VSEPKYHPEWKTGKWRTNCGSAKKFQAAYIDGDKNVYGGSFSLNPDWDYMMGPPQGIETGVCEASVGSLIKSGSVGVYVRDKDPQDPMSAIQQIADKIREGAESGRISDCNWSFDLDTARIDEDDLEMIHANIADCVANGVTQGMCPYWKLEMTQ